MRAAGFLAFGALAGTAAAQPAVSYGPPQRVEGIYRTGFETSNFDGCWVTFTEPGGNDFHRLAPPRGPDLRRGRAYRVSWQIRRTPNSTAGPFQGYGHLGASRCQVEVLRVFRVEPLK